MNTVKNYEVIAVRLDYDMAGNVAALIEQFDPQLLQNQTPNDAKELAARVHLGFASATDRTRAILTEGACWTVEYFSRGDVRESKGGWFRPFSRGMLLCLLIQSYEKLKSLCSWVKPTRKPEYQGPLADENQLMYLILGSLFREDPAKGFDRLGAKIDACRIKEVRLLKKALDAVANRDEGAYPTAIEACVRHHMTKPKPAPDGYFMEDWLPLHANTIYLAGLQLGLQRPDYPTEIAAYLMRPETVGFGG
jgi:hypothetical protein